MEWGIFWAAVAAVGSCAAATISLIAVLGQRKLAAESLLIERERNYEKSLLAMTKGGARPFQIDQLPLPEDQQIPYRLMMSAYLDLCSSYFDVDPDTAEEYLRDISAGDGWQLLLDDDLKGVFHHRDSRVEKFLDRMRRDAQGRATRQFDATVTRTPKYSPRK